eukprot:192871-Chlamydomonas_euryale.AAC.1
MKSPPSRCPRCGPSCRLGRALWLQCVALGAGLHHGPQRAGAQPHGGEGSRMAAGTGRGSRLALGAATHVAT